MNVKKLNNTGKSNRFRLLILAVTIILLLVIWPYRSIFANLKHYGIVGIFLINFISNATIILPLPGVASVFFGGAVWNPVLVGISSGLGAAMGELVAYFLGFGGIGLIKERDKEKKWIKSIIYYFHKTAFFTVFAFSLIPTPVFDFVGILAGSLNYPVWKFFLATLLGRTIRNLVIAISGNNFLSI